MGTIALSFNVTGYTGVSSEGGVGIVLGNPFPGSSIIISVTTPFPSTIFGQGGGTKIAEIPMGFLTHERDPRET